MIRNSLSRRCLCYHYVLPLLTFYNVVLPLFLLGINHSSDGWDRGVCGSRIKAGWLGMKKLPLDHYDHIIHWNWRINSIRCITMSVVEMRIWRWTSGSTLKGGIRNIVLVRSEEVAPIENKMRENLLRWVAHRQEVNKCAS